MYNNKDVEVLYLFKRIKEINRKIKLLTTLK